MLMRFLYFCFIACLLTSCFGRPHSTKPQSEPITISAATTADSGAQKQPPVLPKPARKTARQIASDALHWLPGNQRDKPATPTVYNVPAGTPFTVNKNKGSITVNNVKGDQHNQDIGKKAVAQAEGATLIGKNKGTAAGGAATATNQQDATNAAATLGDGNSTTQTAVPPAPKLSAWQKFTQGVGKVWSIARWPLGLVAIGGAVAAAFAWLAPTSGVGLFVLGWWRKRKASPTPTATV